jgi:hypothetical protein
MKEELEVGMSSWAGSTDLIDVRVCPRVGRGRKMMNEADVMRRMCRLTTACSNMMLDCHCSLAPAFRFESGGMRE